jgi:RimJ/RimL family protein N-acetyltransferase
MLSVLESDRLILRELVPSDLDFMTRMLGHPEVSRYYERTFTEEDARGWIDRQVERYRRDGHGLWLAIERATGDPVGQIGLAMQEVDGVRRPELGWLLAREFWGRGYATEGGLVARDAAFSRWSYPEVISLIRPENVSSRRVAERVGLAPTDEVEFHGFLHTVYHRSATGGTS